MSSFLVIITVVLGIIAVAQLAKAYDLSRSIANRREEDVSEADIRFNGNGMFIFLILQLAFFVWLIFFSKDIYMPEPASLHGVEIDQLLNVNMYIIVSVYVSMNVLLYFFTYKYQYRKNRTAYWYPHNNKLEAIWTIIPAVVMAVIIIYGLMVWKHTMMDDPEEGAINIQLYSKQFDWTVRYAGDDNKLGPTNYNFISGENMLGIINSDTYDKTLADVDAQMSSLNEKLVNDANNVALMSSLAKEEAEDNMERLQRKKVRTLAFNRKLNENVDGMYNWGDDDKVVIGEFYLPVDREILFHMDSRDVIHSAYMPHFRFQMNAVPGMTTTFKMTPTITTKEMREKLGDSEFNYILMCNKICGASHYNMQRNVIVVEQEEYDEWLATQGTFVPSEDPESTEEEIPAEENSGDGEDSTAQLIDNP